MGQSIGTLFGGNLNSVGGGGTTADEVTKGFNLTGYTAIVTGTDVCVVHSCVCYLFDLLRVVLPLG